VQIAKKIARNVRQSSGGLPHVKALGLLVNGRAQVSMNLTDYRKTSLHEAVEAVRAEAQQAGVNIHHSELIGLIPQAALLDTAAASIQLEGFTPRQVLETHLSSQTFQHLDKLSAGPSSPSPAPKAGLTITSNVAAAHSATQAASLVAAVAKLTLDKKKNSEVEGELKTAHQRAESLTHELAQIIDNDARTQEDILAAFKLPSGDRAREKARSEAIEQAILCALQVPLDMARKAVEVMSLAEHCVQVGDLGAIAESAAAVSLARAALFAAEYNLRINADSLQKRATGDSFVLELDALTARAARINRQARHILRERAGLKLE
jgi:glutamate formiminotransferase/formiminotetrahydrofolate cyclodeaminase